MSYKNTAQASTLGCDNGCVFIAVLQHNEQHHLVGLPVGNLKHLFHLVHCHCLSDANTWPDNFPPRKLITLIPCTTGNRAVVWQRTCHAQCTDKALNVDQSDLLLVATTLFVSSSVDHQPVGRRAKAIISLPPSVISPHLRSCNAPSPQFGSFR